MALSYATSAVLQRNTFTNNTAVAAGGALFVLGSPKYSY